MAFCLPKPIANKVIEALKKGEFDPAKLIDMTSVERRAFFEKYVGKDAFEVNAQFEAKLLLKDVKKGLVTWAKRITGISESTKKDIITRIEKLDKILNPAEEKAFLSDLVAKKLGTEVTIEEAKVISDGAKSVQEAATQFDKTKANSTDKNSGWTSENARIEWGLKRDFFIENIKELKNRAKELTWKEWATSPKEVFDSITSNTKSMLSTLDNSFFGRQGLKVLFSHPTIWTKNFIKSFGDIGKELKNVDAMRAIRAEVYSRSNAMTGKYEAMKLDIGIVSEEAFPGHALERVPIFGRLFKAAESAFNGGAMRMRADLADLYIPKAESYGIDFLVEPQRAQGIGRMINSLTGRGRILEGSPNAQKVVNSTFFSIKFLKSNIDTLTAHAFDSSMDSFAKKQAAINLSKIVGGVAATMVLAEAIAPGSIERDSRSSDFGKIKVGNTRFDITGGMASIAVLSTRLAIWLSDTALQKDVAWYKSGKNLYKPSIKFGARTGWDVGLDFFSGKLSPFAGLFRDMFKGQTYAGEKPTADVLLRNLVTPLPIQTYLELKNNPNSAPLLWAMIADGLGISTNTYGK